MCVKPREPQENGGVSGKVIDCDGSWLVCVNGCVVLCVL